MQLAQLDHLSTVSRSIVTKEFYTLADLQNWEPIARTCDPPIRLGVFGDPVEHSLSPQMQNAALEKSGLRMRYARFHIVKTDLEAALRLLPTLNFIGANLTVPHKIPALKFLNHVDEAALAIGAVNTVVVKEGELIGFNTDALAISDAIREITAGQAFLSNYTVLLLGAGGAARAIAQECIRVGCPRLFISNRTRERAGQLRDKLMKSNTQTIVSPIGQNAASLRQALEEATLVINAIPLGLRRGDLPLIPREMFGRRHFVYDTIYHPPQTKLLREAEAAGARVANGLSMLLHQGARSFKLWFERDAPIDTMRAAIM